VSAARARSGVTQRTLRVEESGIEGRALERASISGPIQTAKVLPVPVGEWTSPERPSRYERQASSWKGKASQPCSLNHASTRQKASTVSVSWTEL
jgi:hypothetical protein